MSNTTIQYYDDGRVSVNAKNANPLLLRVCGAFGVFNAGISGMLSGNESADKDIIDAVVYGIKSAFSNDTALVFNEAEIKADAVSAVELCRQDGTLITTVTNEGVH